MFPFPSLPDPVALLARLFNALLRREPWAAQRLAEHAGKWVRFDIGPRSLAFRIQSDGHLQAEAGHAGDHVPDVTLSIPTDRLARLPAVLRQRNPVALAGLMRVQGDAALAHVVSELAQDLRWDVEDELARVVGDAAAVQLVRAGRAVVGGASQAADRLAGNVGEYLAHESRLLLSRPVMVEWSADIAALQHRLDQLGSRVGRLAGAGQTGGGMRAGSHLPQSRAGQPGSQGAAR